MDMIDLPVRYYRNYVEPGRRNSERNLEHAEQTLPLPTEETALLLVDCWDLEHLDAPRFDRGTPIMEERIAPVLEAARESDVTVGHCPSPPVAANYPQWTHFADDRDLAAVAGTTDDDPEWPPAAFRNREGEYAAFGKRADEAARERRWGSEGRTWDSIHESVEPESGPDEFVIATADQLHRLLSYREILHLVYVGFNSNFCVPYRDYGMRPMNRRGYDTILLRDCTKAIEAHDTLDEELCDRLAIREIERQAGWSATSTAFRRALDGRPPTESSHR